MKILRGIVISLLVSVILLMVIATSGTDDITDAILVDPAKTEREIYDEWLFSNLSAWDGDLIGFKSLIKDMMINPKSYEHVSTKYISIFTDEKAETYSVAFDMSVKIYDTVIFIEFKGENNFGNMVTQTARVVLMYKSDIVLVSVE